MIRFVLILMLALGGTADAWAQQRARPQALQRAQATGVEKSLVYIYAADVRSFGGNYLGTGFFVSRGGEVMTASHVVPEDSYTLQCDASTSSLVFDARVTYRDELRDLAILRPYVQLRTRAAPVAISERRFVSSRRYTLPVLYALDKNWPEFLPSFYNVWAVAIRNGFLYLDVKLPGGASGGPVLDDELRVGAVLISTRALPMQLGDPELDTSVTLNTLPDAERYFFVSKAVTITAGDVQKMLEVSQQPRPQQ